MEAKRYHLRPVLLLLVSSLFYVLVVSVLYKYDIGRVQTKAVIIESGYNVSNLSTKGRRSYSVLKRRLANLGVAKPEYMAALIAHQSEAHSYDPLFIAAVVYRESSFNPKARSPRGARGLMQLIPSTAKYIADKSGVEWRGNEALYDPSYNIRLGVAYLKYLENMFKSRQKVLMAYNWGPGNLRTAIKRNRSPYKSVVNYANKVMGSYQYFKKI